MHLRGYSVAGLGPCGFTLSLDSIRVHGLPPRAQWPEALRPPCTGGSFWRMLNMSCPRQGCMIQQKQCRSYPVQEKQNVNHSKNRGHVLLLKLKQPLFPTLFCAGCAYIMVPYSTNWDCKSNNLLTKPMFLIFYMSSVSSKEMTLTLMMLGRGLNLGCWITVLISVVVLNCTGFWLPDDEPKY